VRVRIALLYGAVFVVLGAALLALAYALGLRFGFTIGGHAGNGLAGASVRGSEQPGTGPHHFATVTAFALAFMAAVTFLVGWLLAGRILRPVRAVTAAARRISATSLHQRLALPGPHDEIKELGDTFDALLARLERAFTSQRQFVANASHELRTPLTLQRTLLEAALSDPEPTPESWRSSCEGALAAGAEQERLIEALLTLAYSEGGLEQKQTFDLAAVSEAVLAAKAPEARRRGLRLETSLQPAPMSGDPLLLERLITNLLDNALLYNRSGGDIVVATRVRNERAVLSVSNSGALVPEGEIERLFEPFQRLASVRASHGDGLGLGLAIARAVARAHDAAIEARPRPDGGLTIEVTFAHAPAVTGS
jgi:signal transduction histidine kinase